MQYKKSTLLSKIWSGAWKLPAKLNPWKWAERNISFSSRVSPIPGKFSTDSAPYMREPLEAAADPEVNQISLCWSAQSSKTTVGMIISLYSIDNDPGNILVVRPSLQAAKSLSENRIMIVIDENKALAKHKTADKDDFQKTMIKLKNMVLFIRGANPNQLSAESCKFVWLDETDKYDLYNENKAEADLVSLAFERVKFYKNHLKFADSTPTVPAGIIWGLFQEGDQRLYMVPCPFCGAEFNFQMKQFRFDSDNPRETACFECPHCQAVIEEKHKYSMMHSGKWQPQNPAAGKQHRSYQLPEFYSPITRWGELAEKFVKAKKKADVGDFGQLHNFINSSLAEPWDPTKNSKRKLEEIKALQDSRLEGEVPENAIGLTIGIDTQDLHFWYSIRAWGRNNLESWQIKSGKIATFEDVYSLVTNSVFYSKSGKVFKITAGLIDSQGHRTSEVYDFCRRLRILRPCRGEQRMPRPWDISKIDKKPNGSPLPGGIKLVRINTTFYKDLLAGKMTLKPGEPGAFCLHSEASEEYMKHLCAEYRNPKGIWVCPTHKRNDLYDVEVYNFCCAEMLGFKFLKPFAQPKTEAPTQSKPKKPKTPNPYTEGF